MISNPTLSASLHEFFESLKFIKLWVHKLLVIDFFLLIITTRSFSIHYRCSGRLTALSKFSDHLRLKNRCNCWPSTFSFNYFSLFWHLSIQSAWLYLDHQIIDLVDMINKIMLISCFDTIWDENWIIRFQTDCEIS